ncbi:MAG TPA: lysophospholipid acyltransferase family protein [Chitinispirillaceae bacterium]|nr:lysophospholipid acyltransferase family protein [Chitinispirillaceae bacterium]
MNLSKYIQSPDLLGSISGKSTSELKSAILDKGNRWYSSNPEESTLIESNLKKLGLPFSPQIIENIRYNVILHYYEKLLPLSGSPKFYFDFLQTHVDSRNACEQIKNSISAGKGVLLAIAHFGAVEFLAPSLACSKLPLNVVLRFSTEQFSRIAHERAQLLENTGLFGPIRFIEIGKPGTSAALEMAAALRKKEILISVFDEKTEYSKPVNLFGKKVYGGAGLDKLVYFTNTPMDVCTAFMIRENDDRYQLKIEPVDHSKANVIQQMYDQLQTMVSKHGEQWYFVHEEIPFLED